MYTSTTSDQTDHIKTTCYDSASSDEYLSNSSSYSNNESDLGSVNCNNYEFSYKSDNKEAFHVLTSITETLLVQLPNVQEQNVNVTYTLKQKKFNNKFFPKDLISAIRKILLSSSRDMSNDKESLKYLSIHSFLFLNEKGSSLYNAYDRDEVKNKLVIKID